MKGICKLCRCEAELRRSHYLPRSLYKTVAYSNSSPNESLIHVNRPRKETFSSDRQQKEYLLCANCEQLFSKKGETTVVGSCYKNEGQFTLRSQLENIAPSFTSPDGENRYHGQELDSLINSQDYMYFALSVVWRGSVGKWSESYNALSGALGDKYSEAFRRYLLNPTHPPEKTAVVAYVAAIPNSKIRTFQIERKSGSLTSKRALKRNYIQSVLPVLSHLA